MEWNDVYDENRNLTGKVHRRGTPWGAGEYGLVACVWVYDGRGHVLLTRRARGKSYAGTWENSGGAVQAGETSREAVARELFEETGIHFEIDRLAVVHENFFEGSNALEGYECHEIAFYYLMKPRGTKELNSESYSCYGAREEMCWLPIAELDQYKAFPSFMKDYLQNPSDSVVHIGTRE